jgi:hypothetical protein
VLAHVQDGKFIVEVKRPGAKPSEEQLAFGIGCPWPAVHMSSPTASKTFKRSASNGVFFE